MQYKANDMVLNNFGHGNFCRVLLMTLMMSSLGVMVSNPALFQTDVPCVKCIDRHIFPVFFDVFPLIGVTGRWVPGPCGYFFLSAGFKICKKTDQQKSQMLIPCLQVYMASPTYDKLICMEVWGLKAL